MTTNDKRSVFHFLQRFWTMNTRLQECVHTMFDDEPSSLLNAWARTTAGAVAVLLAVQIITGTLIAFYYVPSVEVAHATVVYIEKTVPGGSWVRAVHHYGSQWLTLFLVLHLVQMFWRTSYGTRPVAWLASVFLLLFVLAGGVTGYSLPWDARAYFGTGVTVGITTGLPLIGDALSRWMVGGTDVSTLTLSRFFALHVLVIPAAVILTIVTRIFVFRGTGSYAVNNEQICVAWQRRQLLLQSLSAGVVFIALALFSVKFHAPLGPAANEVAPGYMPRPGAQFLWLFQILKYLPGAIASIVAVAIPKLIFIALILLPFLEARRRRKHPTGLPRRKLSVVLFACAILFVALMTALAYLSDRRDPVVRAKLAEQAAEEKAFRAKPFEPMPPRKSVAMMPDGTEPGSKEGKVVSADTPPPSFLKKCANCHGTRGQGAKSFPTLVGVSTKPRRTVEDIIGLLNDPAAFGLEPPMRSFATKLTEDEKREIAEWLMLLKKP